MPDVPLPKPHFNLCPSDAHFPPRKGLAMRVTFFLFMDAVNPCNACQHSAVWVWGGPVGAYSTLTGSCRRVCQLQFT